MSRTPCIAANWKMNKTADEADAFLIFESLNARGLDLTLAELLKN